MAQDDLYRGDTPHAMPPGFGPPPYGSPGYPPPGYPPPGYPGAWRRPINGLAIGALVAAVAFAPVGLVLGVVARRQIRQTGEEGDGLALAGIIVGAIGTAIYALVIVLVVVAVGTAVSFGP